MVKFAEICIMVLPVIIIWHFFALFIFDSSWYQKRRFRNALESIISLPTSDLDIIYKNKQFNVNVQYKEISDTYSYYEVWINGALAATYHMLNQMYINSYCFREENKRRAYEVRAIVYAANKIIQKAVNVNKKTEDDCLGRSYFK